MSIELREHLGVDPSSVALEMTSPGAVYRSLTGMRHSQVMRLERDHVLLDHDPPFVVIVDPLQDRHRQGAAFCIY